MTTRRFYLAGRLREDFVILASARRVARWIGMRSLVVVALLASCVPNAVVRTAGDRLGVRGKRLHFMDHDTIDGSDVYTFCRSERRSEFWGLGDRSYDGACIVLVCPAGDDGTHCS